MIGTLDVEVNAAHPNLPLCEFAAFVGSPSHVRVRNVPRGVGNWQITAVYLSVNYPDNSLPSVSLAHVGALWTGTIQGSASAGRSVNGYQITADGTDEDGNAITGYVLGVGDVTILNRDATISVNGVTYYLHLLDAVPDTPHIGDVATIDGSLKLYDGNAWVPFAAGASIDVVAPSTDPDDEGKAADAKATGDALAARPTKAQMDAGWWSKWTVMRDGADVTAQVSPPSWIPEGAIGPANTKIWFVGSSCISGDEPTSAFLVDGPRTEYVGDLAWSAEDAVGESVSYTATRHRVSAPVPTKPSDIGAASVADATLTPVYSQTPTFSEWTVYYPSGSEWIDGDVRLISTDDGYDTWGLYNLADNKIAESEVPLYTTELNFVTIYDTSFTATRTATYPIIGYTLGDQTTKPLQPQGEYAPATNIAKSALASDVQASLGKADTAVQPSALAGYATIAQLPYELVTPTVIDTASSEVVEGETVYYGAATLANRTANIVQVTAATALDELRITFPAATSGKVCDFGLRVEIGTGSSALTAPALVPIAPTGETIKIENNAAEIPALADGTATAKGVTLLYFSETAPGVFLVKGEQVEEVA